MANLKDIGYGVGKYLTASDASDIPDIGTNRKNLDLLNFKVATNNAYALYNFKDGMIDAYQTQTGVDAATSTNETYDSSGKYYSGSGTTTETYHPNAGGVANSYGTATSTVSGTNNETATMNSINSGGSIIMNDQAGKTTGIFTLIVEVAQMGGGGAPNAYGYSVSKNSDVLGTNYYSGNATTNPGTTFKNMGVGDKIKVVYDTDNDDVVTHYVDTGSGYGSALTTVWGQSANWASVDVVTPYFYIVAWSDNATPWILTCSGTREYAVYNNMTLISNAQTAQAEPTEGRLMIYEETSTGSTTLDTDLKGYVSRDGGTTYTQTPLTEDTIYVPAVAFSQGGIDSYTKLMLHCDGANDGTTFTDSSDSPHTVTAVADAHTDTTIKKFGTASYQGDGTGDWLTIPDSSDWDWGTGDFTVDWWLYNTDITRNQYIWGMYTGGYGAFQFSSATQIYFYTGSGAAYDLTVDSGDVIQDQWQHFALQRTGSDLELFIDGVLEKTVASATHDFSGGSTFYVGAMNNNVSHSPYAGYLDEFRVSKGIARYAANFTPPAYPYSAGAYTEAVTEKRLVSGSVDISGQPSGTNMKYKIETLNQSVSKVCRLHGASLLWA